MRFADRPELVALHATPVEAEAVRLRWAKQHPEQPPNRADAMPPGEAVKLLEEVRERMAVMEREAVEVLVHATRSVGKGNDRRSALIVLTLLGLTMLAALIAGLVVWLQGPGR